MILKVLLLVLIIALLFPTWTKKIKGKDAISDLAYYDVNGTRLCVLTRGHHKDNPIILFVHGGPCNSDIPFITKYQKELEKDFTIIHYDQRGSGKSYHFFESYKSLTSKLLVEDLIVLSEMIKKHFQQEIILIGHSYGSYLGLQAAHLRPDLYKAYIGLGQVADSITNEIAIHQFLLKQAEESNNIREIKYLKKIEPKIKKGATLAPRLFVRKYKGSNRQINITSDMLKGHLLNPEYNLKDSIKTLIGIIRNQSKLLKDETEIPLPSIVQSINIPLYFIMGQHDYITTIKAAQDYFNTIKAPHKEFILYDSSAHYPHLGESKRFDEWIKSKFL